MQRGQHGAAAATEAAGVVLVLLVLSSALLVSAQIPEPNCNSNRHEGAEVWSSVTNHIGQGSGAFWWGAKAPGTAAPPVSWIDMCAKRLEVCQADSAEPGSMSGFKPGCVCDMWTCLNRQPALEADDAQPTCHFIKPQLLSFYCTAARFLNVTCSGPAHVPLPAGDACPPVPDEGFTFDDIPGDGIHIPNGYQGLLWDNWFMLDGDEYEIPNGFYAGVISTPKVAFNGYGYPATVTASEGGVITLHSMYLTSAWAQNNVVTITATDERRKTVGKYVTWLVTDSPRFIDFAVDPPLQVGIKTGTFVGVKSVEVATSAWQVALDNLSITIAAEPGQEVVPPSTEALEFWDAPPGASAPFRKKRQAEPQQSQDTATSQLSAPPL